MASRAAIVAQNEPRAESSFTVDGLRFLRELRTQNQRSWFEANRRRFDEGLRTPALRLIEAVRPSLARISPHLVADPRPNGGSLTRIYRDTRFSRDRSPYKTALFLYFWHDRADRDAMPAVYLHVEPNGSMVGGGIWKPATPKLEMIRRAIIGSPSRWASATAGDLGMACSSGRSLMRVPSGYDPLHPYAEDLRRKDFGVYRALSDQALVSPALVGEIEAGFRGAAPLVAFICDAIGLPF